MEAAAEEEVEEEQTVRVGEEAVAEDDEGTTVDCLNLFKLEPRLKEEEEVEDWILSTSLFNPAWLLMIDMSLCDGWLPFPPPPALKGPTPQP